MNVSPPQSSAGLVRPDAYAPSQSRPRSSSHISAHSRPGTAASTRFAEDELPKTAVKVAVRVRPPLQSNDPNFDLIPARFRGSTCHVSNPTALTVESSQGKKLFVFDRVFSDRDDQQSIWEYVSGSVDSFIQGYNVSILAYGQSGAGKSYTMGTASPGELQDPASTGIIARAAASLFEQLGQPQSKAQPAGSSIRPPKRYGASAGADADKNWQLKASYVEIYNEQLRDLLVPDSIPPHERGNVTIREDTRGRIILTGAQQVPINNVDDLMNALNFGSSIRQTDSTNINSKSSRSHAVFSLNLVQKKNKAASSQSEKRFSVSSDSMTGAEQWVTTDSKLHFVDLAGSERLKNSGLSGERVKEGISINAGLASLGKVISQLSSRSAGSHVSYRDSRLTRLLQDSLGGTAITYMVACVNPVEFHLSETLNTVQYAQRARAIQSKPRIQQRAEDGDKQLVIDRLRSEVAFLREQIRSSERSERKNGHAHERSSHSRLSDRENELQNQLLDVQESYSALSQRHAKLISEIAKSKGGDSGEELPALKGALSSSSLERLNRSNTFAEAVEQVVLEYEKTIQSLESSLSNSRSSLSTSESSLLEREAKLVYMEAVTQKLQARVQKAMDREANAENYLKGLENKLETATSSEEKHMIVIQELRKELLRIRESESSAEEYISTLEERLAEAEQDTDIMQREIRRLEHVVERQRIVGKIDDMVTDDEHMKQAEAPLQPSESRELHESTTDMFHDRLVATTTAQHPNGEMLPENAEEEWKSFGPMEGDDDTASQSSVVIEQATAKRVSVGVEPGEVRVTSQAQARAIADKLETVTFELFELKVEHESTVQELDDVSRKYQIALSTLADLQDAMGDAKPRPLSFLEGQKELEQDNHRSSARTLQSELSSRGESPTLVDSSEAGGSVSGGKRNEESLADAVRRLKRANAEKDINMAELTENFAQLSDQHQTTLKYAEELKEELTKANKASSPTHRDSLVSPTVIRRSASSYTLSRDRESRAYDNLRNLAVENLQGKPQAAQSFDQHLTTAATESKMRNDRVDTLEAEVKSLRNEMEVKNTMISGLTRERSAVRTNPAMDMSMISTMRDHVMHSQKHLATLFESGSTQHLELLANMRDLHTNLNQHITSESYLAADSTSRASDLVNGDRVESRSADIEAHKQSVLALQKEVSGWEAKHHQTTEAVQQSQQQLMATINGLETSLSNAEALHAEKAAAAALRAEMRSPDSAVDYEAEKAKHVDQVAALQKEIDGYKATADTHSKKLLTLESSYEQIIKDVEQDAKSRQLTESELQTHRERVRNLEQQIEQQKSLAAFHQDGLKSLEESHAKELDELRQTLTAQQAQSDKRLKAELGKHQQSTSALQEELTRAHVQLAGLMESVALVINDQQADATTMQNRLRDLADEQRDSADTKEATAAIKRRTMDLESQVKELSGLNESTLQELEASNAKGKKSSRMVQDLEAQLSAAFDQHKNTESQLFTARKESETQLKEHRSRISKLETELNDMKRMTLSSANGELHRSPSEASNLRKSSSHASLPSPPPATPLPPLPGSIEAAVAARSPRLPFENSRPSSPRPRTSERDSAALQATQAQHHQELEEKEQRIKTIEKHLYAEKQLTQTLEEALVDLETQANKTKAEVEAWKKKCREVEDEATGLRRERGTIRNSLQAVEEERDRRIRAEVARKQLEERMEQLGKKKKKQGTLNCF